ncbi:MAG: hypothetical protein PHV79_00140 [Clostridia bacterium]|jgi:hypothetical protein|nr:hypothetical protein [Clostridia bacterium]
MVEFFEIIKQYLGEFLALIGVGSVSIGGIVVGAKAWLQKIMEKKTISKTANAVFELFKNKFAEYEQKLTALAENNAQLKTVIDAIKTAVENNDSVPTELKAYITLILSQKGNEAMALEFEQIKSALIEEARNKHTEIMQANSETIIDTAEKIEATSTQIVEAVAEVDTTVKKVTTKAKKVAKKETEVVYD